MSASVCINNVGFSPENFLGCPPIQPSPGWISPSLPFSRDFVDEEEKNGGEKSDEEDSVMDFADFEFCLSDPVTMISADELFSDGKLVPLHLAPHQQAQEPQLEIRSPKSMHSRCEEKISGANHVCSFSPKAPRCSRVWKELLSLKKVQRIEAESQKAALGSSKTSNTKSLKNLLRLNTRSHSIDSNLSSPLLRDSDSESVSISARGSLSSSSSSGADHEDPPRLSLESDKIIPQPISPCRNPSRLRTVKAGPPAFIRPLELRGNGRSWDSMRFSLSSVRLATESESEGHAAFRASRRFLSNLPESDDLPSPLGPSFDSPRLNASGKVIFQGLERSSSNPSFCNGDPRSRPRGMVRSRSANVMVTPVLNVPFCSLRSAVKSASVSSFGPLFSLPKREKEGSSTRNSNTVKSAARE